MTEEHATKQLAAYALGCLAPEEAAAVAHHLQYCDRCRADLRAYEEVTSCLALAAPDVEPSAGLRARVMAQATAASRRLRPAPGRLHRLLVWAGWAAVVVLALVSLLLWQRMRSLATRPQVVALNATEAAPGAGGSLMVEDAYTGVLVVHNLEQLDAERQYQLWLVDADGQRDSGCVFSVGDDGSATLRVASPLPLPSYASVGVTVEPTGGSPGPTGAKVLGGQF